MLCTFFLLMIVGSTGYVNQYTHHRAKFTHDRANIADNTPDTLWLSHTNGQNTRMVVRTSDNNLKATTSDLKHDRA